MRRSNSFTQFNLFLNKLFKFFLPHAQTQLSEKQIRVNEITINTSLPKVVSEIISNYDHEPTKDSSAMHELPCTPIDREARLKQLKWERELILSNNYFYSHNIYNFYNEDRSEHLIGLEKDIHELEISTLSN